MDAHLLAGFSDRLEWHDELGSTNDRARSLAAGGAPHGFVVGTDCQTAGRGRKGAEWVSEAGRGLAFSVVVRPAWPPVQWGWLSLAAGLAVCEALVEMDFTPTLKWPNDVLLDRRKLCGILIEAEGEWAVIGVGINVNDRELPEELAAVSLAGAAGREFRREEVLGGLWKSLMEVLQRDPPVIAEAVWARLLQRDAEVLLADGSRGRVRGFGVNGELNVETGDRLVSVSAADGVRLSGA